MKIKIFECNPFCENTYVLYDEISRESAIIDCGCYTLDEKQKLADFISDNSLKIKYLLNTHLHLDHVFGNAFVTEKYGVLSLAHQADEILLDNFEQQLSFFGLKTTDKVQPLGGYLTESDVIEIGDDCLKILHVPGHSLGSLCFYSENTNAVFVGDVLFRQSIGRTDLQGGDYAQLIKGITEKLFNLPDETIVYAGHGPITQIGFEKQNNPYL